MLYPTVKREVTLLRIRYPIALSMKWLESDIKFGNRVYTKEKRRACTYPPFSEKLPAAGNLAFIFRGQ